MADRDQTPEQHAPADIDAAIATLAITVDPATGEPSFRVSIHCGDDIGGGDVDELHHALGRFRVIQDQVRGQWLAGHEDGGS